MKAIIYPKRDWAPIWERIKADHGQKISISWVCRRELGFTVREHMVYGDDVSWDERYQIHLDFYDEAMRTLFILKYT